MKRVLNLVLVVLLGVAILATAVPVPAQTFDDEIEGGNGDKFFDLAACTLAIIVAAPTVVGWIAVGLTCGKAAYTWWST